MKNLSKKIVDLQTIATLVLDLPYLFAYMKDVTPSSVQAELLKEYPIITKGFTYNSEDDLLEGDRVDLLFAMITKFLNSIQTYLSEGHEKEQITLLRKEKEDFGLMAEALESFVYSYSRGEHGRTLFPGGPVEDPYEFLSYESFSLKDRAISTRNLVNHFFDINNNKYYDVLAASRAAKNISLCMIGIAWDLCRYIESNIGELIRKAETLIEIDSKTIFASEEALKEALEIWSRGDKCLKENLIQFLELFEWSKTPEGFQFWCDAVLAKRDSNLVTYLKSRLINRIKEFRETRKDEEKTYSSNSFFSNIDFSTAIKATTVTNNF